MHLSYVYELIFYFFLIKYLKLFSHVLVVILHFVKEPLK